MKTNYRDNINEAATEAITASNSVNNLLRILPKIEGDLRELANLKPANPRDFIHVPDALVDPRGDAERIRADLRSISRRFLELQGLAAQGCDAVEAL